MVSQQNVGRKEGEREGGRKREGRKEEGRTNKRTGNFGAVEGEAGVLLHWGCKLVEFWNINVLICTPSSFGW